MKFLIVLSCLFAFQAYGAIQKTTDDVSLPKPPPRPHCFTLDARILTSQGYKAIGDIQAGEYVLSFEPSTGRLVENKVVQVHVAESQDVFEVASRAVIGQLCSTLEHPFYEALSQTYIPLEKWKPSGRMMQVREDCKTLLQPLEALHPAGRATVKTLSVEKEPHNFIVEGVLVHNKPIVWPAG